MANACSQVLTPAEFDALSRKQERGVDLTPVDYQRMWVYSMACNKYNLNIPEGGTLDQEFIKTYVGTYKPKKTAEDALDLFLR